MRHLGKDERGGVPTLAIFSIFILVISFAAITYFQTTERQAVSSIQQRTAADVTRATASAIEAELSKALRTAAPAAMYHVGMKGGDRRDVEENVQEYLNNRILKGWSYSNFENIYIPTLGENDLIFQWQPDGSVVIRIYLPHAVVRHIAGPTVYGVKLKAYPRPRFDRIKYVAKQVIGQAKYADNISEFEGEINENYASEGLKIELWESGGEVYENVKDIYGGRAVILD